MSEPTHPTADPRAIAALVTEIDRLRAALGSTPDTGSTP